MKLINNFRFASNRFRLPFFWFSFFAVVRPTFIYFSCSKTNGRSVRLVLIIIIIFIFVISNGYHRTSSVSLHRRQNLKRRYIVCQRIPTVHKNENGKNETAIILSLSNWRINLFADFDPTDDWIDVTICRYAYVWGDINSFFHYYLSIICYGADLKINDKNEWKT